MRSAHVLVSLVFLLGASTLAAQAPAAPSHQAIVVATGTETWGPAPAILPPGAELPVRYP
jgi:hypothetical protein